MDNISLQNESVQACISYCGVADEKVEGLHEDKSCTYKDNPGCQLCITETRIRVRMLLPSASKENSEITTGQPGIANKENTEGKQLRVYKIGEYSLRTKEINNFTQHGEDKCASTKYRRVKEHDLSRSRRMTTNPNNEANNIFTRVIRRLVTKPCRNYQNSGYAVIDNIDTYRKIRYFHDNIFLPEIPIYNSSIRNMPGHIVNLFYGGNRTGTIIVVLAPTFSLNADVPEVLELYHAKIKIRITLNISRENDNLGRGCYFLSINESFYVPLRHRKSDISIMDAPWRINLHCSQVPIRDINGEQLFAEGEYFPSDSDDQNKRIGVTILGQAPNMYGIYRRQMYSKTNRSLTWQFPFIM